MARYSEHDTSKINQAAESFRANCLLCDGALMFDDAPVWRLNVLCSIHMAFVAILGDVNRMFTVKLKVNAAG